MRNAVITIADNSHNQFRAIVKWDGTNEGKDDARREAHEIAHENGVERGSFVIDEIWL